MQGKSIKEKSRDWWSNARIGVELDARRKLTDDDKLYINKLYHKEKLAVREIARIFEKVCSRRLIQFVLFPERLKIMQARNKKNQHWKKYYNKEKKLEYMRTHRENIRRKFGLNYNKNMNKYKAIDILIDEINTEEKDTILNFLNFVYVVGTQDQYYKIKELLQ